MIPILVDGPALEPVSLAEAKAWLKIEHNQEDDLIAALIVASRLMVEAEIHQVLIGQNWRLIGDRWPFETRIPVRVGHVLAIQGGRVYDSQGQASPLLAEHFVLHQAETPPMIEPLTRPQPGRTRSGIEIDVRLGFGEQPSDVPQTIRLAIRRLIALWYEDRGDKSVVESGVPPQIRALLRPFRRVIRL